MRKGDLIRAWDDDEGGEFEIGRLKAIITVDDGYLFLLENDVAYSNAIVVTNESYEVNVSITGDAKGNMEILSDGGKVK